MTPHKAIMIKLIHAKHELEYFSGFNQEEYVKRAIADIDKAIDILIEQEEWRGEDEQ